MRRCTIASMLVWISLVSVSALGQGATVKLCVANTELAGTAVASTTGRDLLLKFLNKEKPAKALSIERVPIDASTPSTALAEAGGLKCDYVVTTNQTESHVESAYTSGVNLPAFYVTIAYKLTKVSDSSEVSSDSLKASDHGSEQNAIGFAMHKIADKVTEAIKKAGPAMK
jgi:hypothetical protein